MRLEPCAMKVASTVLRGRSASNGTLLPDESLNMSKHKSVETLMIYNEGLDNLENNAVHTLKYDFE